MKQKDILLAARPDQSVDIYHALEKQDSLTYTYIVYKVIRRWMAKIIKDKRLKAVDNKVVIPFWRTLRHLAINKFNLSYARKLGDFDILDSSIKRELKKNKFKLIHYWPENGGKPLLDYRKKNPRCIIFADIHMPHPQVVFEEMKPVFEKFGIVPELQRLFALAQEQGNLLEYCDNALVPSEYVVNTYRQIYPNKKYFIVPYGATVSPFYKKRDNFKVKEFVYAGRVSLEKGADLLLEYFSAHSDLNIHIFGSITPSQNFIFEKYKSFNNIIFHGQLPKVELQRLFVKYDVGIHLSRFDAYSLAVGEMIGGGLPVIVSEKTGNFDTIRQYGLGVICKLDLESIDLAVKQISFPITYKACVDNIDKYIHCKHIDYGEEMVEFYKNQLATLRNSINA